MTMINYNQYNVETLYCYNLKDMNANPASFTDLMECLHIETPANFIHSIFSSYATFSTLLDTLFKKFISLKYERYTWITSTEELDFSFTGDDYWVDVAKDAVYLFQNKLFSFINATVDRYYSAISNLGVDITKLITGTLVTNSSDVKALENDTPQTQEGITLWADKWASRTNHNVVTSTTDSSDPFIDRVNKAYSNYINLMEAWADEFEEYLDGIQI